jgi:hypothetical protein
MEKKRMDLKTKFSTLEEGRYCGRNVQNKSRKLHGCAKGTGD